MSTQNRQVVDTRGLVTTGLTSSTTVATHLAGLETAVRALRTPGNDARIAHALAELNDLADLFRRIHL